MRLASGSSSGKDNIIATLEQSNRVCEVAFLCVAVWQLEKVLAAMQVPFPELTYLELQDSSGDDHETVPVIPDLFLDGSAPRLRHFHLSGIPFPGLPKLLLSATHLVDLELTCIPHSGYISPEAMAALLCALSSLENFRLEFQSPESRPHRENRSLPSPKRSVLPALRGLLFHGVTEYLEELVTRIDTPQLDYASISLSHQIDSDIPRLAQFINRTPVLTRAGGEAHVSFDNWTTSVLLVPARYWTLNMDISCETPDRQLSSIAKVCNSSLQPLSVVEELYITYLYMESDWTNNATENILWLQFLLPFTAVKNLYLSKEFAPGIAAALQELVGDRITEVLPSLQNIFVEASWPTVLLFRKMIDQFVDARQRSDHPIAISDCELRLGDVFAM
jgi:hypothetical protein